MNKPETGSAVANIGEENEYHEAGPFPVDIDTPLAQEMKAQTSNPLFELANMRSNAMAEIKVNQDKKAAMEAWRVTGTKQISDDFATRERDRAKQIDFLHGQIAGINKASEDDANDMRAKIRNVEAKCLEQTVALDTIIKLHETVIKETTK